jgi:amidophosphoribosyltransferase
MSASTELIAANKSKDEIMKYIGADALFYLKPENLDQIFSNFPICKACFTGEYPAGNITKMLHDAEEEKNEMR